MKQITEKQMELADDIFWLIMEYVDTKQFIKDNGNQPSESTEQGRELLYGIEDLLTKKPNKMNCKKLKKELDWFRNFGYKVNQLSSSVNNKACMYADAMQEGKRFPQSEVHKYAEWILTKCDKPKDEMTWLIQTILESNNAHCLDDIFDTMLHE